MASPQVIYDGSIFPIYGHSAPVLCLASALVLTLSLISIQMRLRSLSDNGHAGIHKDTWMLIVELISAIYPLIACITLLSRQGPFSIFILSISVFSSLLYMGVLNDSWTLTSSTPMFDRIVCIFHHWMCISLKLFVENELIVWNKLPNALYAIALVTLLTGFGPYWCDFVIPSQDIKLFKICNKFIRISSCLVAIWYISNYDCEHCDNIRLIYMIELTFVSLFVVASIFAALKCFCTGVTRSNLMDAMSDPARFLVCVVKAKAVTDTRFSEHNPNSANII